MNRNSASTQYLYGVVVGGHDGDPDPLQANNVKIYIPGLHGKDVKPEDLAFSTRLVAPDRWSQGSFTGGIDPGTLVVVTKDTGSNQCQILGMANDLNNRDQRIEGNIDLLQSISRFFTQNLRVNIPPNIQQATEGGAQIFRIINRGKHSHDILRGLPTHAALFPMAGSVIAQIKNITTAIQADGNILGGNFLAALPGTIMSLGSLVNLLTSNKNYNRRLNKNMNPAALAAFTGMSILLQNIEQNESAGFMPGTKVDQDTYAENAIELLSQTTNVSDVVTVMRRLQTDVSLTGIDKFGTTIIEQQGPYGTVYQSYTPRGRQATLTPATVIAAASSFASLMSGFPSSVPGQNMFGSSAGTILSMMQRVSSGSQLSSALALVQVLNQSGAAQILQRAVEEVTRGGNPLRIIGGGGN